MRHEHHGEAVGAARHGAWRKCPRQLVNPEQFA